MKKANFYYLLRRGFFSGGGNAIVQAFKERVLTDSGTFEAFSCVSQAVNSSPEADAGRLLFEPYAIRVTTDGGATEARTCTINAINALL
jgi:hypothetical protein